MGTDGVVRTKQFLSLPLVIALDAGALDEVGSPTKTGVSFDHGANTPTGVTGAEEKKEGVV